MLSPKKMKFRKESKGRVKGRARGGDRLAFGDYGIMATENGRITARQIEASRIAMTRHIKRGGKVWIKVFPHHPVSKKPAEVRMGKGKGSVDRYEARINAGRILFEMHGVEQSVAVEALKLAAAKLPIKTRLIIRGLDPWVLDDKPEFAVAKKKGPAAAADEAGETAEAPAGETAEGGEAASTEG